VCGATGVNRGESDVFKLSKGHFGHQAVPLEEQRTFFIEKLKERAEKETKG